MPSLRLPAGGRHRALRRTIRDAQAAAQGTIYQPKGCENCVQTGYRGRLGIFEFMLMSETLKNLILQAFDAGAIKSQALKEGLITLQQDAGQKVLAGIDKEAPLEVNSLRDLYTTWINVCEDIYADFAMSDDYQAIYGRMVNAFMAMKQESESIMDKQLEALNMPTRREVDAIAGKLQMVKRENRKLRAELEGIKARLDGAAKPQAATRAAPKKKVTKKKVARKAATKKKTTARK